MSSHCPVSVSTLLSVDNVHCPSPLYTPAVQSLSSLSGLEEFDARANPLQCDGDAACIARTAFLHWLNDSVDRLTLPRHPDAVVDEYSCQDSGLSYISAPLDCDAAALTRSAQHSAADDHGGRRQYTGVVLFSISAVTVLLVAAFILTVGLIVGRRY